MGNRVEDLEREVAQLRATVDGLTEELVETKERVATLEGDGEPVETDEETTATSHAEFVPNRSADDHADSQPDPADDTEETETTTTTSEAAADGSDDDEDDIIVA